MTDKIVFKVNKRDIVGKRVRHLRNAGVTPAVAYGTDHESVAIEAKTLDLDRLMAKVGTTTPFTLELDGKKRLAIVKKIERDPIKGTLKHIDFQTISAKEKIQTEVPIHLVGREDSPAERAGLVVMQVLDEIEIAALPADMVSALEVSIAKLAEVGDRVTVSDLALPQGVELADSETDPNLTIVNVYDPVELEAANEAAGGDATDEAEVESEHGGESEGDKDGAEAEKSDAESDKPEGK